MNADTVTRDDATTLSIGRLALIVIGGLLLIWLIVRSLAIASGGVWATKFARDSGEAIITASGIEALPGDRIPDPAQMALLRSAARNAPLRYEPFLAQGVVDRASGRWADALRAGEAARDREPRAVAIRGLLLEAYMRQRRYPAAIAQLNALVDRNGDATPDLLRVLTLLADNPQTSGYVAQALRVNPRWRSLFVDYAGEHSRNKGLLFKALLAHSPAVAAAEQQASEASFVNSLVASGDYQRAYLAWVNFLPPQDTRHVDAIYDGEFRGFGGGPPFNWVLTSDENAVVERTRDTVLGGGTALDVQYYGRTPTKLAQQILLVPPGDYVFSGAAVASSDSQFGGALAWNLACLPSGTTIPLIRLTKFSTTRFRIAQRVTIPAEGCVAQQLVLTGEPGEIASLIAAQFNHIALVSR